MPVAVIPKQKVQTAEARMALPAQVSHADAAFNVARAALLGAGLAQGDAGLLAAAFADRLHEPVPAVAAAGRDPGGAAGGRGRRDAVRVRADGDRLGRGRSDLCAASSRSASRTRLCWRWRSPPEGAH